jgi:type 2 lantibiotic biosynthesis protein LanM
MLSSEQRQRIAARASSLYERIPLLDPAESRAAATDSGDVDAILAAWSQAFSQGDLASFQRRLGWDGLDEASARRAAAVPSTPIPDSLARWTAWLDRILAEVEGVRRDSGAGRLVELADWTDEPPFVEVWAPILRAGCKVVTENLPEAVSQEFSSAAFLPQRQQLMRELAIWAELAVLEMFRASVEHEGPQPSDDLEPGDRGYRRFIDGMLDGGLIRLFEDYPVLARQIATVTAGWAEATRELLIRLDADRQDLGAALAGGRPPGQVVSVDPALSDPHHGRRRVVALTFASGLKVAYKPRPIRIEAAFQALLRWLRDRGLQPAPPALRVLDRQDYGWVEFAAHGALERRSDAAAYYRRAGSLLAVAHLLRARDLHQENVVATEAGPVLVDLETLFQPVGRAADERADTSGRPASVAPIEETCLATGLLSMFEAGADGRLFDVGGLRGSGEGSATLSKRMWSHLGSDAIRFELESTFSAPAANTVRVNGIVLTPDEFGDEVLQGFTEAYHLLLRHRTELAGDIGPLSAFAGARTRVVPRPTNQYAMLSAVLAAPRYQRDGARRSAAMDVLLRPFTRSAARPGVWPLVIEERRALDALDVPYFWTAPDTTEVVAGSHPVVSGYFVRSGGDAVVTRLQALSEDDRTRQADLVALVLSGSPKSRFATPAPAAPGPPVEASFLRFADWIAAEMRLWAREDGDGLIWPRPSAAPDSRSDGRLLLYDGAVGIALFFAAHDAVSGADGPRDDVTERATRSVLRSVEDGRFLTAAGDRIGVADGLGSLVYGLTWIARLTGRAACLDAASVIASEIDRRVATDRHLDLLSGAAGAILACLALEAESNDARWLDTAAKCADRLRATGLRSHGGVAWPDAGGKLLVGFAHGAAGIAYALWRLFVRTDDAATGELARQAYAFERSLFVPGQANWPIAAAPDQETGASAFMNAWCHGAPGILLANVPIVNLLDADTVAARRTALATVAQWAPARADHLCCGTLGRCETLLAIGRRLGLPAATAAAYALAAEVATRASAAGHFRLSTPGFEYCVFDAGFFRGVSGIGYELLRLAAPEVVPSVLSFEAPDRTISR